VTHSATIAEVRLKGMTVTIGLTHTQRLDEALAFGPLVCIAISSGGIGMELDLTPGQVKTLARVLTTDGGPQHLAKALTAAQTALEEEEGPNGED
jgi:hypothetical protein